jgi:hypothetical protein
MVQTRHQTEDWRSRMLLGGFEPLSVGSYLEEPFSMGSKTLEQRGR